MKRDRIKTLLLAEALICALLALALWLFEGDAFSVTGFPGSAVGQGLSALAASGRFGSKYKKAPGRHEATRTHEVTYSFVYCLISHS